MAYSKSRVWDKDSAAGGLFEGIPEINHEVVESKSNNAKGSMKVPGIGDSGHLCGLSPETADLSQDCPPEEDRQRTYLLAPVLS